VSGIANRGDDRAVELRSAKAWSNARLLSSSGKAVTKTASEVYSDRFHAIAR
jgi:hypothetical protein